MLTRRELFLRAYGENFAVGESHNTTLGFNAVSAVAALAALDLIDDACIARVHELGGYLARRLGETLNKSPLFREVRGAGFMRGVALTAPDHPWLSFEHFGYRELADKSAVAPLVCHRLYRSGFFCFSCGHDWSIFRLQPRFFIEREQLDEFVEAVGEALSWVEGLS